MNRIQTLPRPVAERIAAGEVIERPSSVVKELVENSIDAGSTQIEVSLEDGGKSLIQVTDNGSGIHPDDLALALERHATSKLSSLEDLERIETLGFRGEALPSIAAVSDLEILSRQKDSKQTYQVRVTDSYWQDGTRHASKPVTFGQFLNSPNGTQIRAQSLFSTVPARQKFLKSSSAETAQVRDWLERLSLTHPKTGFRLLSEGKVLFQVRPESELQRVQAVLTGGEDFPIVQRSHAADSGIQVRAYWVQGMSLAHTRKLVQVVNGRAVRDRLLQQAILNPFKQALLPGQFPAVAVFVEMPLGQVDVNVHPTKTEIRFLDSSKVFHAVAETLSDLIREKGTFGIPSASGPESNPSFYTTPRFSSGIPVMEPVSSSSSATPSSLRMEFVGTERLGPAADALNGNLKSTLFQTYIVIERGEELVLVDQHAADERIRYEKLKQKILDPNRSAKPQQLLIPEVATFEPEFRTNIDHVLPILNALGFETELFSDKQLIVRSIPSEWGNRSVRIRLQNLVNQLTELSVNEVDTLNSRFKKDGLRSLIIDEKLFEKIASEACRSSVMAGDTLGTIEAAALVEALKKCEHPWNCPHGRPTLVRIPKNRVEEWFQRKL